MDVVVAGGGHAPGFRERGAPGGEQDRHVLPRSIDESVQRVRRADADVHHHGLRLAGHHRIAVRHRDAEVLVRHDDDLRQRRAELLRLGIGFGDRREVGAAVREQVLHPAGGEKREPRLGSGIRLERRLDTGRWLGLQRRLDPLRQVRLRHPLRQVRLRHPLRQIGLRDPLRQIGIRCEVRRGLGLGYGRGLGRRLDLRRGRREVDGGQRVVRQREPGLRRGLEMDSPFAGGNNTKQSLRKVAAGSDRSVPGLLGF